MSSSELGKEGSQVPRGPFPWEHIAMQIVRSMGQGNIAWSIVEMSQSYLLRLYARTRHSGFLNTSHVLRYRRGLHANLSQ
jgi:hypothetical protein